MSNGKLNANDLLQQLDELFATKKLDEVEPFLLGNIKKARACGDVNVELCLLNELIGYYREMTMVDKAKKTVDDIQDAIKRSNLIGTLEEGTSYMNIANAYRFLGEYDESLKFYKAVESIYSEKLALDDFRWPSLFNNISLLYSTIGDYESANEYLKKALELALKHEDAYVEIAVTYTNIGQNYTRLNRYDEALEALLKSKVIFDEQAKGDYHYGGCANALGALYYTMGQFDESIKYYEDALISVYDTTGMTGNYKAIYDNLCQAYDKAGRKQYESMLDLCEAYYECYGKPMLERKFPEYVDKIAVGLCGEGSECYGFDDGISLDHDCGPGFAMYVSNSVYDEIGEKLQEEYNKLPRIFAGHIRTNMSYANSRVGVCTVDGFFERVMGGKTFPTKDADWLAIPEYALACATNGRVFYDPVGDFTNKRNVLNAYYPKNVWLEKLSRELIGMAQTGQYNYSRMMAREEYVTVRIIISQYMEHLMNVVFLLNKEYAPYYKWTHKAMKKLLVLPELAYILEAINDMPVQKEAWENVSYSNNVNENDMIAMTIEIVARMITEKLKEMGLSNSDDVYLEKQALEVAKNMSNEDRERELTREEKIDLIVELEWKQFDQVQNEGGRASCQDDWGTFSIMRKSQYMTWTEDMMSEFLYHFNECLKGGRNIITEKYGRMMESTTPAKYEEIKDSFPAISEARKQIQETIIKIQVEWMEEFAEKYPTLAANSRSIHTSEDNPFNTSYETYLRGELGTYSPELLDLYGRFIANLAKEGKNLAYETMSNTVKLYGYESVEAAETAMS